MEWLDRFYMAIGEGGGRIGPSEMAVRALVIFIFGVAATRVGAWRAFGRWSSPDIVVAIIVGSNLSRALTGPAPLFATIGATTVFLIAWWVVSFAASRSSTLDWLFKGGPIKIVSNGEIDSAALRKALVSERDLHEGLRQKGVATTAHVVSAQVERNGSITVIRGEDIHAPDEGRAGEERR
jgi:uncharacterized membrane protein YcaP (DUF421 family)